MTDWTKIVRAVADPRGKRPDPAIVAMIADHADDVFARYGITTIRRQACILAHACVEMGNFTTLEENLNYSAERLHVVWPKRFPTVASAQPYDHNPRALANKVYNGRMGNRAGTDDGWLNRGKGLWQCTGRENVEKLAAALKVSIDVASAWLVHPDHALECACALFNLLGVRAAADAGDVVAQTLRVNGGKNALDERKAAWSRAIKALSAEVAKARVAAIEAAPADAEPLPMQATLAELRAAGSRTIAGADQVKQGVATLATAATAASAMATQIHEVAGQAQSAVDSLQSAAGALAWTRGHAPTLIVAALILVALLAAWRIWRGASLVAAARVDDAVSGLNIGR
ncbi:glycoside hydrolase family 19 protein [Methylosinus sp. Sm6]|uniref:glycoside hydrolase family 19 protein n=1 Tax=Methylosinus sp. Sm6 TaxID=2866948 RepID=UPI001C99C35E|nr:glycoside hydrolase family 19 protein [Methylosinus sp. Sm6]MBY6242850.1 glycoside hydrolase family 19 protein [Methylosinus sp. Sm6]